MDKKTANQILSTLDATVGQIEALAKGGKIDPRLASSLIRDLDGFADKFEVAAFGQASLKARQAKVLQKDSDEKYMDTFKNPQKPIQTDADEPYMHKTGPTFSGKGVETYDSDDTSQVTDRDEYNVRDLNDMAGGTKKQPSWTKGPAGKSTKQGATRQASASAKPEKTWAP
jgi:hypothetical protein